MKRYELVVVGAGPAGLSAAVEAASTGMETAVFDENACPGGQLFKQIHKFFGSKEHKARIRGLDIGAMLVEEARQSGAQIYLDAPVIGIYPHKDISVVRGSQLFTCKADNIILATGASENAISFPGWTLPGVMGAGAAQTLTNLHGVRPGRRILMVGTGNVGLVVALQLVQAGCEVVAMTDISATIGGYGVHASKLARTGIPFFLSHTVIRAEGGERVERAVIARVDSDHQPLPGTERELDVDVICLAVGLSPMYQLAMQSGCQLGEDPERGGIYPVVNGSYETSVPGIFAAGDVTGIEEASAAMLTGKLAGASAARRAGYISCEEHSRVHSACKQGLDQLRGADVPAAHLPDTVQSLLHRGYLPENALASCPGFSESGKGFHPVAECLQHIPCNPCEEVCPSHCISVGDNIMNLPVVRPERHCNGCFLCVSACPGQAIFLVDDEYEAGYSAIALPYEFPTPPAPGTRGRALDRSGRDICSAEVVSVKTGKAFDRTSVLVMKVPRAYRDSARFFREEAGTC